MKALILSAALIVPAGHLSAPVYVYISDGLMGRSGTFVYKPVDGYTILYCIAEPPKVKINCVVQTPQNMLALIDVIATEQET
jgi:hypothetical protein